MITLLLAMLVFGSISVQAESKTIYKKLKAGQTVTQNYYNFDDDHIHTYVFYSFSVPSPGMVTFSLNNVSGLDLYTSKNKPTSKNWVSNNFAYYYDSGKQAVFTLDKGTYYLRVISKDGTNGKCKVKYGFKKATFSKNYCASKVAKLSKKKTIQIAQTSKNHYSRWFKIVLTKKQAITFFTNQGSYVSIFDDDMEKLDTERAGSESPKYFTKTKLPKGTYYAKVSYDYYRVKRGEGYVSFKWQ